LTIGLVTTLVPLVLADKALYGTWKVSSATLEAAHWLTGVPLHMGCNSGCHPFPNPTSIHAVTFLQASLWNFILYNVAGGGQSALYGVESADYYLRNGLNQLQLVLPLALALPAIIALAWTLGLKSSPQSTKSGHRRVDLTLAVAVAPFFVWLAAITSLPHKEERFLYVVYPLACLAAAATLDLGSRLVQRVLSGPFGRGFATGGVALAIAATGALSLSRSAALLVGYGAPMQLYKALPPAPPGQAEVNVCVGAEWHRFPSSFFLPGPQYHLRFIKSGFDGLLPRPFADEDGGTRAAPRQLNDQNREEPENYWPDAAQCDYVVTLGPAGRQNGSGSWFDEAALGVAEGWTVMAEQPFVDGGGSPALTRAFFIPGYSRKMNKWLRYALLERRREA